MKQVSSTTPNSKRTSLHQEVDFKATPQRIYETLLSSKDFAAFTGAAAEIDPKPGGAFSLFGGMVVGRNIELVPNQSIVQAWRVVADFPDGVYTMVKFELKPRDSETSVFSIKPASRRLLDTQRWRHSKCWSAQNISQQPSTWAGNAHTH